MQKHNKTAIGIILILILLSTSSVQVIAYAQYRDLSNANFYTTNWQTPNGSQDNQYDPVGDEVDTINLAYSQIQELMSEQTYYYIYDGWYEGTAPVYSINDYSSNTYQGL